MADAKKTSMFNQLLQNIAPAATHKQQYQQMLICQGTIPPHVPPSRTVTHQLKQVEPPLLAV